MGRLFRFLLYLVFFAFLGLVVFAFVGDLSPDRAPVETDITIDVD